MERENIAITFKTLQAQNNIKGTSSAIVCVGNANHPNNIESKIPPIPSKCAISAKG